MGQAITVSSRAGASSDTRIFDCNRSLTGMAIERYASPSDVHGQRPPDVLARRLFDLGATSVTVYSNAVAVVADAARWGDLEPRVRYTLEHLFEFYGDDAGWSYEARGVEPPPPLEPPE
jgi:hypothetical protein